MQMPMYVNEQATGCLLVRFHWSYRTDKGVRATQLQALLMVIARFVHMQNRRPRASLLRYSTTCSLQAHFCYRSPPLLGVLSPAGGFR